MIIFCCLWVTWTSSPSPPGTRHEQNFLGSFSGLSKLLLGPLELQNAALHLNPAAKTQSYASWIFTDAMFEIF